MPQERGDRFRGKTENYSRGRPDYPDEIIDFLTKEKAIDTHSMIADIGSGTGKLAKLFLKHGFTVTCVEPNPEMRAQAELDLNNFSKHRIIDGTAEKTGLPDHSVDLVVAGQAFHWFDPAASGKEFRRILKPGGKAALIWNDRVQGNSDFNQEYERICVTYSNGYHKSGSLSLDRDSIGRFFDDDKKEYTIENGQKLDLPSIKGRYFSASYALGPKDKRYEDLVKEIEGAYSRHAENGYVTIKYVTRLFLGTPTGHS